MTRVLGPGRDQDVCPPLKVHGETNQQGFILHHIHLDSHSCL